jgi:hypothetical protein
MSPSIEGPAEYWAASGNRNQDLFETDFVPTEGTRLPIVRSGDFGRLPFWGQLSGKQYA